MNRKIALIGASILSAIAVVFSILWLLTDTSRVESRAILLQAKTAYAPGHAAELAQYSSLFINIGFVVPQFALLAGIALLGMAVLRMSFALSRRIESRIIHRGEQNGTGFYIAPPQTRVGQYLLDRGISVWDFDSRIFHHNREIVDSNNTTIPSTIRPIKKSARSGTSQKSGKRISNTIRRKR